MYMSEVVFRGMESHIMYFRLFFSYDLFAGTFDTCVPFSVLLFVFIMHTCTVTPYLFIVYILLSYAKNGW
jgi:hypothetical protein